jgi:hypothetical protein
MNENIADGNTGQGSPEFRSNSKPRSRNGKKVANTDNTNKQRLGVLRIWKRKISEITVPGLDDTRNPQKNPESQFQSDSSRSGNENLLPGKNRSAPTEDDFANTRQQRDLFHRYINAQRREGEAKEEVEKVQKECRDIRNQQDVLTEEKRRLVSQLTELKEENLRGAEKIKTQEGETERIREDNRILRLENEKLEAAQKSYEQEKIRFEDRYNKVQEKYDKTVKELNDISEKNPRLERQLKDANEIRMQDDETTRIREENRTLRLEKEKLESEYKELDDKNSREVFDLTMKESDLEKTIEELQKKNESLQAEKKKLESRSEKDIEAMRLQIVNLERKKQVEVQSARQECEEIRKKYDVLLRPRSKTEKMEPGSGTGNHKSHQEYEKDIDKWRKEYEKCQKEYEKDINKCRKEYEKCQEALDDERLQNFDLEQKRQVEVRSARQECEEIRKKYNFLLLSRSNVSQPLQTENESFSSEREEFEQQRSNMEAQIQRLRQTIENLRSESVKTAAENAILRMQTILSQREKTSRSPEHKEFTSRPPPREDNLEYPQENDRPGSEGHDSNGVFLDPCTDNMSKEAKDYQGGFNEDLIQYIQTTLKNNRNTMVHSEKIEGKEYYYVNIKELKKQIDTKFRVNLCDDEIIGHVREDTGYNPPPGSVRSKIEHDGSSFCYVHNPPEYVLNKSSNSASLSESKDTGKMTKPAKKTAEKTKKSAEKTAEKTAKSAKKSAKNTAKPAKPAKSVEKTVEKTAEKTAEKTTEKTAETMGLAETEDEIDESESDARGSDEDSSGSDNE